MEDFSEMSNCQYEKEMMRRRKLPRLNRWHLAIGRFELKDMVKTIIGKDGNERCEI
jgi:hypothetical protein